LIVLCETHHLTSGKGIHSLGLDKFVELYGLIKTRV
jgi:hypothetical protein